jgi:hypothetical protein
MTVESEIRKRRLSRAGCVMMMGLVILLAGLAGCAKKTGITTDRIWDDLTDTLTGKIQAGNLGWATPTSIRTVKGEAGERETMLTVDIKAEQNTLSAHYDLSARLRLHYQWQDRNWVLHQTEEVRKWRQSSNETPEPGQRKVNPQEEPLPGDSAVEQLQRARRLTRRGLYSLPMIPP